MTLFLAYVFLGAALTALGAALSSGSAFMTNVLRSFPRSAAAGVLCFGGGAAWFLWTVFSLGESDLAGFPRNWMLGIFGATALLSFWFLRELLAVRGLAVLMLLVARELLDAAYMQQPLSLVLASTTYVLVVLGIVWGAAPYLLRDWLEWLLARRGRSLAAGVFIALTGAANLACAFFASSGNTHT
jgi:hypothetical protein